MTIRAQPVSKIDVFVLLAQFRELALVGFILTLIAVISLSSPNFATFANFTDILLDISILAMVALAQGMIIITRGIDLSVASMLALTAMMVAFVIRAFPETPLVFIVLAAWAVGGVQKDSLALVWFALLALTLHDWLESPTPGRGAEPALSPPIPADAQILDDGASLRPARVAAPPAR